MASKSTINLPAGFWKIRPRPHQRLSLHKATQTTSKARSFSSRPESTPRYLSHAGVLVVSFATGAYYHGYSIGKRLGLSETLLDQGQKSNATPKKSQSIGVEVQDRFGTASEDPLQIMAEQSSQRGVSGVVRHDAVRLRCNEPVEDRTTYEVFKSPWSEKEPSWSAWGVFDGHLGWQMSDFLSKRLVSVIRLGLEICCEDVDSEQRSSPKSQETVVNAIQKAFVSLDNDVLSTAKKAIEDPKMPLAQAVNNVVLAYAGSCAVVSLFDPTTKLLHVACTGDSRAVLGRRNSNHPNNYSAIPLSIDQSGKNADEVARLRQEHPDEPEMVKDNRVLGLAVSRAFGDFLWKLDVEVQRAIRQRFFRFSLRPHLQTPPYLTAKPEVTTTHITQDSGNFLIMASDGFWDCVSNDEAVELIRRWKEWKLNDGKEPTGPKDDDIVKVRDSPPGYKFRQQNTTIRDENAAMHLLRNALGGGDEEQLRALLSFEAPQARSMRDDITIRVIFFDDQQTGDKLDPTQ